jgi:hypothetical protein
VKRAADLHLEYQFAVSPLMADVANLIKLAADIADKRDHETVRGYGKSEYTQSYELNPGGGGWNVVGSEEKHVKVQNIIRCGMTANFIDSLQGRNSSNTWLDQLDDFSSLPLTAWELTPFSFLVDYFVNVQDIIQSAVVTQAGIAYTSNSLVRSVEWTRKSGTRVTISRPDVIKSIVPEELRIVRSGVRDVTRTSTLLGIPPVVFSLPGSNIRYANIAALLTKLL